MDIEKEEAIAGAAGTVGAAAITSGLAGVGGIVGGGMAAGLVITAAAPIAIGTGAFFAVKGIKKLIRGY